ncbi:hypothetical protein [Cellulosilyticum sp. I15G10I2]|uniref:hypothetical protein n=1 Tax=Cellulosilyticum sp. I15G10I2 TaxID=1892843 RepID=UPI00085C5C1D|nr:hypothetical protein [Cellulosilyticum sp. I15G10I2]
MIKQEINYITQRKNKFLKMSLIWAAVIIVIYVAGFILIKTRSSYFTLIAALFVLPFSQNIVRFISFNRFKDAPYEFGAILEGMRGSYNLFHSAIIPDNEATILFEHLIITSTSIYFLTYDPSILAKHRCWLENRLSAKGVAFKDLYFISVTDINSLKKAAFKIEKDAGYRSDVLDQNTKIIEAMLM